MRHEAATTRAPAVAGQFYPGEPGALRAYVDELLQRAAAERAAGEQAPRAMALPHAGYPFSGAAAVAGYALLAPARARIRRVVLLGPSHFVPLEGMALPEAEAFATPLGEVPISAELYERARVHPAVQVSAAAHAREHSLEVHLPFLQRALEGLECLPIAVGRAGPEACGGLMEQLWDAQTLLVVSTDLSHFYDDATARRLDRETTEAVEALDGERLDSRRACGAAPLRGLLWLARRHGLRARTVAQCNSADATGDRSAVVGYASYVLD